MSFGRRPCCFSNFFPIFCPSKKLIRPFIVKSWLKSADDPIFRVRKKCEGEDMNEVANQVERRVSKSPAPMAAQAGFTLLELMAVVAIVAILSAIGFPSYSAYVVRSRITEATSNLSQTRVLMEQYFQDNRRYVTAAGGAVCGIPAPAPGNPSFTYAVVCTDTTYTITATGNAGQGMSGYSFDINEVNLRRTVAFPGASGLPLNCWINKSSGTC